MNDSTLSVQEFSASPCGSLADLGCSDCDFGGANQNFHKNSASALSYQECWSVSCGDSEEVSGHSPSISCGDSDDLEGDVDDSTWPLQEFSTVSCGNTADLGGADQASIRKDLALPLQEPWSVSCGDPRNFDCAERSSTIQDSDPSQKSCADAIDLERAAANEHGQESCADTADRGSAVVELTLHQAFTSCITQSITTFASCWPKNLQVRRNFQGDFTSLVIGLLDASLLLKAPSAITLSLQQVDQQGIKLCSFLADLDGPQEFVLAALKCSEEIAGLCLGLRQTCDTSEEGECCSHLKSEA